MTMTMAPAAAAIDRKPVSCDAAAAAAATDDADGRAEIWERCRSRKEIRKWECQSVEDGDDAAAVAAVVVAEIDAAKVEGVVADVT